MTVLVATTTIARYQSPTVRLSSVHSPFNKAWHRPTPSDNTLVMPTSNVDSPGYERVSHLETASIVEESIQFPHTDITVTA
ncbi:MAG: hypothetical protein GY847_04595 [Proteobacteria bacterium]|nr:hypothetical protein [Pseudomonadota bacterium]